MARLFNQAIYLTLLRSVFFFAVVLTFIFLFSEITIGPAFIALLISIIVHQIAYALKVPFLCDNLIDIVWMIGETGGLILFILFSFPMYNDDPDTPIFVMQDVVSVTLLVLQLFVLSARIYLFFQAREKGNKRPFNLRKMRGVSILFGKSLWKARLIGETKSLIVSRGILASCLLAGILTFFYVNIFTGAFQELQFIPTQNTRTAGGYIPFPDLSAQISAGWGVTLGVFPVRSTVEDRLTPNITAAVEVTPLWNQSYGPSCTMLEVGYGSLYWDLPIVTATYYCPSSEPNSSFDFQAWYYSGYQLADLLVTVDFGPLLVPPNSLIDITSNSVQVLASMTNNTEDVLAMTRPTILIPGVNLVGLVSMEIHQTFKNPGVATLGIFENTKSTLVGQITQLYPDPSTSPLIKRGANISTLRLSIVNQNTQWNIIRDVKNNSFLGGFSKVGGLWTFLSGVFTAIFGSSLMRVLFGNKPIVVFGFAHRWEREAINKAYRTSYPAIREEMAVPPEQRGLLCLIQDHIVDLNLIDRPDPDESESHELTALAEESEPSAPLAPSAA